MQHSSRASNNLQRSNRLDMLLNKTSGHVAAADLSKLSRFPSSCPPSSSKSSSSSSDQGLGGSCVTRPVLLKPRKDLGPNERWWWTDSLESIQVQVCVTVFPAGCTHISTYVILPRLRIQLWKRFMNDNFGLFLAMQSKNFYYFEELLFNCMQCDWTMQPRTCSECHQKYVHPDKEKYARENVKRNYTYE